MGKIKLSSIKTRESSKKSSKKRVFFIVLLVLVFVVGFLIAFNKGISSWTSYKSENKTDKTEMAYGEDPFNNTIIDIAKIDSEYGTSLNDYQNGLEYLKWHPRQSPMNAEDFDSVISDLNDIAEETDDEASLLLINARIKLFEAEQHYTDSTRSEKARLDDGFRCGELPYVETALENTELGITKAKEGIDNLNKLSDSYPANAEVLQISKFWLTQFVVYMDKTNQTLHEQYAFVVKVCAENVTTSELNSTSSVSEEPNATSEQINASE